MTKLKNRWLLWILPLAFFVSCKSNEGNGKTSKFPFLKILYLQKPERIRFILILTSRNGSSLFMQIQQTAWGVNCIWTDGAI